jgi:hypothetical protein
MVMEVRQAQFRRVLDRGGQVFAEVEVLTDHQHGSQLLAYFRSGEDGSYPLVQLISNDADTEIDWFDNSQHTAFQDVTASTLSTPDHLGKVDRDQFASLILAYPGVAEALSRNL